MEMGPLHVNCKFFAGHVGLLQFDWSVFTVTRLHRPKRLLRLMRSTPRFTWVNHITFPTDQCRFLNIWCTLRRVFAPRWVRLSKEAWKWESEENNKWKQVRRLSMGQELTISICWSWWKKCPPHGGTGIVVGSGDSDGFFLSFFIKLNIFRFNLSKISPVNLASLSKRCRIWRSVGLSPWHFLRNSATASSAWSLNLHFHFLFSGSDLYLLLDGCPPAEWTCGRWQTFPGSYFGPDAISELNRFACFSISVSVMEHKGTSSSSAWFSFLSVLALCLLDVDFEKIASFTFHACSITLRRMPSWHNGQTESGTHEKWKECLHPLNTRHLPPCTWQLWRSHSLLGSGLSSFFTDWWKVHGNTLSVLGLVPNRKGRVHSCRSPVAESLDKELCGLQMISKKIDFNTCAALSFAALSWLRERI